METVFTFETPSGATLKPNTKYFYDDCCFTIELFRSSQVLGSVEVEFGKYFNKLSLFKRSRFQGMKVSDLPPQPAVHSFCHTCLERCLSAS